MYKCIKDFEPGTYFTKGKIYNITLSNSTTSDHYIENFDSFIKGHLINWYWWNVIHQRYLKKLNSLNINIKIL